MEQRIGSSSQPLEGAGFDPAFIPGLTSPAKTAEPEDARPVVEKTVEKVAEKVAEKTVEKTDGEADELEDAVAETTEEPEEPEGSAEPEEPEGPEETDDASEGPVFEASDRRAEIVADHQGVRLRLDDQQCEFRWDEIGAIETESARFGKRFTVTVHTPDRRWYPIEIEATARSRFKEWEEQLDAVLDAYFDDDAE